MGEDGKRDDMAALTAVASPAGALERIFEEHHTRVFNAAYRVTGNAADAEEVLQTVFLRLCRQGWRAGSIASLEAYLCRAAINAALDVVRARRDALHVPLEQTAPPEDVRFLPDRPQANRELRDRLRRALRTLSPRAGEIFALRYLEGYANREIARMLDISQIEVAVSLHRSRGRLKRAMQAYVGDRS